MIVGAGWNVRGGWNGWARIGGVIVGAGWNVRTGARYPPDGGPAWTGGRYGVGWNVRTGGR